MMPRTTEEPTGASLSYLTGRQLGVRHAPAAQTEQTAVMVDAYEPERRPAEPPGGPLEQRVADADRDRTVTLLREHVVDGRITLDEFSERVGLALEARTRGDLEATLANLPGIAAPQEETVRRRARRRFI